VTPDGLVPGVAVMRDDELRFGGGLGIGDDLLLVDGGGGIGVVEWDIPRGVGWGG